MTENQDEIGELKKVLPHEFKVRDLGNLKYLFQMEFTRTQLEIVVS